jgi:hypothetical protein
MTPKPVNLLADIRQRHIEAYYRARAKIEIADALLIEDNRIVVQAAINSGLCSAEDGTPADVRDWTVAEVRRYAGVIRARLNELLSVPGE